jgi:hypothetical protein
MATPRGPCALTSHCNVELQLNDCVCNTFEYGEPGFGIQTGGRFGEQGEEKKESLEGQ